MNVVLNRTVVVVFVTDPESVLFADTSVIGFIGLRLGDSLTSFNKDNSANFFG